MASNHLKAWEGLKSTLHWNRFMAGTWTFMALAVPLGELTNPKECTMDNWWQGALWVGLTVVGALGVIFELLDDMRTDISWASDLGDVEDVAPELPSTIVCWQNLVGRGWMYLGRFFSNVCIMGLTLIVMALIYMKDPSCFVNRSVEPSENLNPAYNQAEPSTHDVPFVSPPSAIKERQDMLVGFLAGFLIVTTVTVAIRILACSYVKPTAATKHIYVDQNPYFIGCGKRKMDKNLKTARQLQQRDLERQSRDLALQEKLSLWQNLEALRKATYDAHEASGTLQDVEQSLATLNLPIQQQISQAELEIKRAHLLDMSRGKHGNDLDKVQNWRTALQLNPLSSIPPRPPKTRRKKAEQNQ